MKLLKTLLIFFFFGLGIFNAQKIENVKIEDNIRLEFISKFQKLLFNKYAGKRREINFSNIKLTDLKIQYLKNTKKIFPENNNNIKLIGDYSYYTYYPDIAAIIQMNYPLLKNKVSDEEKQKYNELFLEISKQIPTETYIEISKITDELNQDKFALTVPFRFDIFEDLFNENQRKRIDIINFLLWNLN